MNESVRNELFPVVLGIDWSDKKHDLCLWDGESRKLEFDVVKHRPEVLHEWICRLRGRFPGQQIAVGLDQ